MTKSEEQAKLAELDRLLNDPDVRLDPERVWTLLAELSAQALAQPARRSASWPDCGTTSPRSLPA